MVSCMFRRPTRWVAGSMLTEELSAELLETGFGCRPLLGMIGGDWRGMVPDRSQTG